MKLNIAKRYARRRQQISDVPWGWLNARDKPQEAQGCWVNRGHVPLTSLCFYHPQNPRQEKAYLPMGKDCVNSHKAQHRSSLRKSGSSPMSSSSTSSKPTCLSVKKGPPSHPPMEGGRNHPLTVTLGLTTFPHLGHTSPVFPLLLLSYLSPFLPLAPSPIIH